MESSIKDKTLVAAIFRVHYNIPSLAKFSRGIVASISCFALLLSCTSLSHADEWNFVRAPLGVYAHIDIETAINRYKGPAAGLRSYLRGLYKGLLADPAISGMLVGQHWDNIQLSDPNCIFDHSCSGDSQGYDWSYLDDAFEEANWAHKTVQLSITPGTDAPPWLFAKIPSCDGLFPVTGTGSAPADCGKVTFIDFPEVQRADGSPPVMPLPWNSVYNEAWWDFLVHLNARYAYDPAFVSMAIAGPILASNEFILPTTNNGSLQQNGMPADKAWSILIKHSFPGVSSYHDTDQVFIDQWKQSIDVFERIFRGMTLFLSPDAGNDFPEFSQNITVHPDNTLFAVDCSNVNQEIMSCEAKTEILSKFITEDGPNGKATQVGGMTASSDLTPGDIGVAGIKVLTSLWPPPSPRFLGGAEFDFAVSDPNNIVQEGCSTYPNISNCGSLTPEEAANNVLLVFFYGTPVAPFYGGVRGPAPIQYLELDYVDIQYAQMNPCPNPDVPSPTIGKTSLQDLLNRASHSLFEMAGRYAPLPPHTCP
jgi:hypothetical protein